MGENRLALSELAILEQRLSMLSSTKDNSDAVTSSRDISRVGQGVYLPVIILFPRSIGTINSQLYHVPARLGLVFRTRMVSVPMSFHLGGFSLIHLASETLLLRERNHTLTTGVLDRLVLVL